MGDRSKPRPRQPIIDQWLRAHPGQGYHISELARLAFEEEWTDPNVDDAQLIDRVSSAASILAGASHSRVVRCARGTYMVPEDTTATDRGSQPVAAQTATSTVTSTPPPPPPSRTTVPVLAVLDDGRLVLEVDGRTGIWTREG